MENFNAPGLTAEGSLGASLGQYRTQMARGSAGLGFVQPQKFTYPKKGNCWCSEPDTQLVCTSDVCHEIPFCRQYACP